MRQILQDLKTGKIKIEEVPAPSNKEGQIVIQSKKSLISKGTEKMLLDFGKAGYLGKLKQQPEKAKEVINKLKSDGFTPTIKSVSNKLNEPVLLGYSNVGIVQNQNTDFFEYGDRVVSNSSHADFVRAPVNLCAKIPDKVSDDTASFTILSSIALHGIRLINPSIGEIVVVSGLGVVGLLAVQILKANGCKVVGIDYDSRKCELAKEYGADVVNLSNDENPKELVNLISAGRGADSILITASSSKNEVIETATDLCRKRGSIVLIGVIGLELNRNKFYEKELTFQVSCSYGPGRYDANYENKGIDYPYPYVRWTEKRNFETVLYMMSEGLIKVEKLIDKKFLISDALLAYKELENDSSLGILLDYSGIDEKVEPSVVTTGSKVRSQNLGNISFIGSGAYAYSVLAPNFKKFGANFVSVVSSSGVSSTKLAKHFDFYESSTNIQSALDDRTDTVVIATQHNLHHSQIIKSLENSKNVFVEKPLALNHEEVDEIENSVKASDKILMVGFNRRFSPQILKIKELLQSKHSSKAFIITINAGKVDANHWTQDKKIGGGRIIGEACHHVDLMRFLSNSKIKSFSAIKLRDNDLNNTLDKAIISLVFEDGSIGAINYLANGGKSFPKERVEVFCEDAILQLDNYRKLKGFNWKGFRNMNLLNQNKGQSQCINSFMQSIKNGTEAPIPINEIFEVARVSIDISNELSK